jgi:RNA polymerase sigma-70 factor, ECF subfamily
MTEKELIEGLLNKEREAVKLLVDTYQEQVIKTAFHFLGNMEDAEDLSQDIFLEILNSIHSFRQASRLSTWIYRISVNYSLNEVKKNKRRQIFQRIGNYLGITNEMNSHTYNKSGMEMNELDEKENREFLQKAVDALPEKQRTAFVLNKYEDLSHKEIAEITGLSVSSVESLIHRAKQNLQIKLVQHFSEYAKN